MSPLDGREARRFAMFNERLLAPAPDNAHEGMARALLASRYRWERGDRQFLRMMVCRPTRTGADWSRLMALLQTAREHVR